MIKQSISGRRRARALALQALYQWLLTGYDLPEIEAQFRAVTNMDRVDVEYFCRLLYGVCKNITEIEEKLLPFLDRKIKELNPVELSVLRLGAYELLFCLEIPYRVILNEAIALDKTFGSQDGHRYINGVLNNLAQDVRSIEIDSSDG